MSAKTEILKSNEIPEDNQTAFGISVQFPNTEEKIKTQDFLEASRSVVSLVDRFGKVFAPVVFDMNRNIEKICNKFLADRERYEYIEDLVFKEKEANEVLVIDALQWQRRALDFVCTFFEAILENDEQEQISEDLTPFFKRAYAETLEQYHGWLGTQLYNVMSRFAPTRSSLLSILSLNKQMQNEMVLSDMRNFTTRMKACVNKLENFYAENDFETFDRI